MQIKDLKLNYIYFNEYFYYKVIYISKDNDYAVVLKYNEFRNDNYIEPAIFNNSLFEIDMYKNIKPVEDLKYYKLFDEFKIVAGNTIHKI